MPHAIHYDPLKADIGQVVSRNALLRRLFFTGLGMLFLRQWYVRAELKRIARERRDSIKDIYDAGSGFGQYTYQMGKLFPDAHILAVDVKEEQIDDSRWFSEQRGHSNTKFQIADLVTFRKENSFDLALNVDVLEHIEEDEQVWANIHASLRPGGTFIMTTPSATEGGQQLDDHEDFSVIGEHVREGYLHQEILDKAARAGFKIETLKRTYGPLWGRLAWQMLQRVPMRLLSISKLLAVIVVPWMLVFYLPAALCMWLDMHTNNRSGGGWLLVARKEV